MRAINTDDAFNAARIIEASGIKAEIERIVKQIVNGEIAPDIQNVGVTGILRFVELFTSRQMQQSLYEILAGPYEMEPEKIGLLSLKEQMANIRELSKDEGLADFFDFLSGILGQK